MGFIFAASWLSKILRKQKWQFCHHERYVYMEHLKFETNNSNKSYNSGSDDINNNNNNLK